MNSEEGFNHWFAVSVGYLIGPLDNVGLFLHWAQLRYGFLIDQPNFQLGLMSKPKTGLWDLHCSTPNPSKRRSGSTIWWVNPTHLLPYSAIPSCLTFYFFNHMCDFGYHLDLTSTANSFAAWDGHQLPFTSGCYIFQCEKSGEKLFIK